MLGADRALALAHVPAPERPAVEALFAIDAAMGDVVRTTSQPPLGAIRLAWWREQLEALDEGGPPPAEPRLRAVSELLLPKGLSGSGIARLEDGWLRLFDDFPWGIEVVEATWFRGRFLFAMAAQLLGGSSERIEAAGGLYAIVDAARHCSEAVSRMTLLEHARTFARGLGRARIPPPLRPLSMLAALAARDALRGEPFEPQGTRARALAMLGHRVTGKLPAGR